MTDSRILRFTIEELEEARLHDGERDVLAFLHRIATEEGEQAA